MKHVLIGILPQAAKLCHRNPPEQTSHGGEVPPGAAGWALTWQYWRGCHASRTSLLIQRTSGTDKIRRDSIDKYVHCCKLIYSSQSFVGWHRQDHAAGIFKQHLLSVLRPCTLVVPLLLPTSPEGFHLEDHKNNHQFNVTLSSSESDSGAERKGKVRERRRLTTYFIFARSPILLLKVAVVQFGLFS